MTVTVFRYRIVINSIDFYVLRVFFFLFFFFLLILHVVSIENNKSDTDIRVVFPTLFSVGLEMWSNRPAQNYQNVVFRV